MLLPKTTKRFEKDKEKSRKQKRNFSVFNHIVTQLIEEKALDLKYCDHSLKGEWEGFRDCHIQNDWVLIYKIDKTEKTITFVRLGSHSELFK